MLCTMPIIKGCCASHQDEDDEEIEFTNINRGDGMQEPMMGMEYQAVNGDDRKTDELINKR